MRPMKYWKINTMTNIVSVRLGEPVPTDHCLSCNSTNIRHSRTIEPNIDFLNLVVGAPYPTFKTNVSITNDYICRDCGAHWGHSEITDEVMPPENLPYNIHTRERIDVEFARFELNLP